MSRSTITGRLCPTRPVGPRDGGGLTQILAVVLGLTYIALCRPLPPEDRRRDLMLNCAFHRIAVTQARIHPHTRAFLERKRSEGKSNREALRSLKRHLVRRVPRLLAPPAGRSTQPISPFPTKASTAPAVRPSLT